ncbi:hypothetical protein A2Z22_01380 [Candidatus Woesebacteria bacterium RBG_16_34_12]|uniref:Uncharacterized protein n=1 Tax=Candidatus Woesebacteria bacterium RBG_16_34_12 TaxID=1802480 RepID=A0A1F7XC01_9BACT|nr:MAG: hypothetical protein A2Z22_01380 [Candidatus Woesebacteria bacterium RBG_16_34_12]
MKRGREYKEYIENERQKIWEASRYMLWVYTVGLLQEAVKEEGKGRLFRIDQKEEGLTLEEIDIKGGFRTSDFEKPSDFVLVDPRGDSHSYLIRLRMFDDDEYPHSFLQVVRCGNPQDYQSVSGWFEILSGVEIPKDMVDSYNNLDSMVARMKNSGLVTANLEIYGSYETRHIYSHRDQDLLLQDYYRWVADD